MSEWGTWIKHDGTGWPPYGHYGRVEMADGSVMEGFPSLRREHGSWRWLPGYVPVVRFQIRKPRGLTILEDLIESVPVPKPERVDA